MHSAVIRSGRLHGDELARQPAARLSQRHSPTEARAARSRALPAQHTRALPLPGHPWGKGLQRQAGGAPWEGSCPRSRRLLPVTLRGHRFLCRASATPTRNTALAAGCGHGSTQPPSSLGHPGVLSPSVGSQPASPLGARRLAVQPGDGPRAAPCPQAHGHITPIIPVAAVPKAELCHSPCDRAVSAVPVAMPAVPWLCHTHGCAIPVVPIPTLCPQSPGLCRAHCPRDLACCGHATHSHSLVTPGSLPAPPHSPKLPLGSGASSLKPMRLAHAGRRRWAQRSAGSPAPGRLSARAGCPGAPSPPRDAW